MTLAALRAKLLGRIHWAAVLAALPTIAGVLADPDMLALLPANYAHALTFAGCVLQLMTRAVTAVRSIATPLPREDSNASQ